MSILWFCLPSQDVDGYPSMKLPLEFSTWNFSQCLLALIDYCWINIKSEETSIVDSTFVNV